MHYAISDIHGHTKTFMEFANSIKPDDTVYVLGDVIDKGDGTMDVLRYIMDDPRFVLLLGNHEYIFYDYMRLSNIVTKMDEINDSGMSEEEKAELEREYHAYLIEESDSYWLCECNDTMRTIINCFIELPEEEQKRIFEYIHSLPIQVEVTVNDRTFVLTHAVPNNSDKIKDGVLLFSAFEQLDESVRDMVWTRDYYHKVPGKIVVVGHNLNPFTFDHSFIESDGEYDNDTNDTEKDLRLIGNYGKSKCLKPFEWACIDTGLACSDSELSKLGILCLEDLSFEVRRNLDDKDRNPLIW